MNHIPSVPLKHITTKIGSGATPRGGKEAYRSDGIALIRSLNVYDLRFANDGLAFIDDDQAAALSNVTVETNDILLNITGASVARCCMVPSKVLPARVNQHTALVRVDRAKADPRFVLYCLVSPQLKHHLLTLAQGGATREALTKSTIEEFEVPCPPLPTQRKIADILSTYDDLIENNTRRIQILEEMAQSIYREWFIHFRFPGHEDVEMVETELGLIPKGWDVKQLGDLAQEVRRSVQPDQIDPDTPYLGLEHFPRRSIALSEWGTAKEVVSTKLAFKEGEILFGKIRPYFHKVGIAPVDGVCSSDTIVIVPRQSEFFGLTLSCVSSTEFVDYATLTSKGTKMPRADWSVLVNYPLLMPPKTILSKFDLIVRDHVTLIENLLFRNRNLRQTRDLLLPNLVSGEIKIEMIDGP